jgi:hypothetical protein
MSKPDFTVWRDGGTIAEGIRGDGLEIERAR